MHARPIPVTLDRFAVQLDIHFIFLAETHEQIASGPSVIRGLGRAFGEDLEFPLTFRDFSVDTFVVDTSSKTEIQVFVDDFTGYATHVFVAHTAVVWTLRSLRIAVFREPERTSILIEEVLLLETYPQVRVVLDGSACIRRMGGTIRVHDFAEDDATVLAADIRIKGHRL